MIITQKSLPRRTLLRGLGTALAVDRHGLVADRLPVVAQLRQLRKPARRQERVLRNRGEQIEERVERREQAGVLGQLALEPHAHAATEVHEERAGEPQPEDKRGRVSQERAQAFQMTSDRAPRFQLRSFRASVSPDGLPGERPSAR